MPRKPTGMPRGRRPGSGMLGQEGQDHTRLTIRIPTDLYQRLEAFAEGRSFTRGTPQLARSVREAIEHYLACPQRRQTTIVPRPAEESIRQTAIVLQGAEYDTRQTETVPPSLGDDIQQQETVSSCDSKGVEPEIRQPAIDVPTYDIHKYFLGELCKHGHDYDGTGQSLRRRAIRPSDQECLACQKERASAARQRKRQAQQA